ncbi:MAG: bifunctional nuclease domain-containing protein [Prevotella sp.]
MPKVRLYFSGVSEIVGGSDIALIILSDESRMRQLSIVCDKAMAVQIELRVKSVPITSIMLPEVLCRLLRMDEMSSYEIHIDGINDGQYIMRLANTASGRSDQLRASDAILLSVISDIPLYIDQSLLLRQSVPFNSSHRGISIPINSLSEDMLNTALEQAIKDENYEMASYVRDEINRRKKK